MAGTYASLALILAASAAAGQGVFLLCGRRQWSWLSPAVGLAVLTTIAWGGLSLTDEPVAALAAAGFVAVLGAAAWGIRCQAERVRPGAGTVVLLAAVLLASLPFIAEARFGILGTSLNPDMSQHLFAADRLASGGEERLIAEGYPLGPHALAVAVAELGPSLVQSFGGLTLAVAVAASLAPLSLLGGLAPGRRIAAALLVGFAYLAASYLIQGSFKETLQALYVLAFAIGLHEFAAGEPGGQGAGGRWRLLGAVPLAALAVGAVYTYSFPGLTWIAGALGIWALAEMAARGAGAARTALAPAALGASIVLVAVAPELGRIADFASFETFDPDGAGLGNLFNPISPVEALGIWPSGDFRLDPGAGFAPAAAFWLGGLVGLAALGFGLRRWLVRGERAVPAAIAAAALLYLYALVAGTPYQEAKALAIAAPLAMLVSVRALFEATPPLQELRAAAPRALALPALAVAFGLAAAGCSALALANGPVGPGQWTPDLIELRESGELGNGGPDGDDTLVLAPEEILAEEHGEDLYLWELRGGKVCADAIGAVTPPGVESVITYKDGVATVGSVPGQPGPDCPLIADGDRADLDD